MRERERERGRGRERERDRERKEPVKGRRGKRKIANFSSKANQQEPFMFSDRRRRVTKGSEQR